MKPIDTLKKGLKKLKHQVQAQAKKLQDLLKQGKKISHADEKWLDDAANLIDEEWIVEVLDQASIYLYWRTNRVLYPLGVILYILKLKLHLSEYLN